MVKGHDWICQCREGGKDQDKTHEFIHVRHKDWNLAILTVFPVRKVVPHLWGTSVGLGSFPLLPLCHLWWLQECAQAVPGLREQTRWCNSSGFISLAINKGNTTDGRLLLPTAPDLFRILPSRVWLSSWVFLGIIQGSSKAQTENSCILHISRKDYLIRGGKKRKGKKSC